VLLSVSGSGMDDRSRARGHHCLMPVIETDAVWGSTVSSQYLDHLCGAMALSYDQAVHHKPVSHTGLHAAPSLQTHR